MRTIISVKRSLSSKASKNLAVIFLLLLSGCSRDCEHECVIPDDHKPAAEKMFTDCVATDRSDWHFADCRRAMKDIYCNDKPIPGN